MEAVHAREDVELGVEQSFKALLAFVARVDLNAPIFNQPKLVLQLISIGRVTVHQILQSIDLLAVTLERLTDLVFEIFDFDVLIEVRQ